MHTFKSHLNNYFEDKNVKCSDFYHSERINVKKEQCRNKRNKKYIDICICKLGQVKHFTQSVQTHMLSEHTPLTVLVVLGLNVK